MEHMIAQKEKRMVGVSGYATSGRNYWIFNNLKILETYPEPKQLGNSRRLIPISCLMGLPAC